MERKKCKKRELVDGMTKDAFVKSWLATGMPPDDPFMRTLTRNGLPTSVPVDDRLRTVAVAERMWKIREDRKLLVEVLRSPRKIAECLEEHNLWRRGQGKYADIGSLAPYSAYFIGKLLEGAANCLTGSDTEVTL